MIVKLFGGLGNQLFQCAFGRSVAHARNEPVFFEKWDLDGNCTRAYSLGAFNVDVQFCAAGVPEYHEKMFCFDPDVYKAWDACTYIGHWQTERYFNEQIVRKDFTLRHPLSWESQKAAEQISGVPSCSIHVRRGDYLHPSTAAFHGNMDMQWYDAAIERIESRVPNCHFFVFSDDPAWCKETFKGRRFTVVGHNGIGSGNAGPSTEHEDMHLMSLCNHAIIPNSTFSWWGAWLNPDKERMVIAPKRWFASNVHDTRDILPERWIKQ